MSTRPVSIDTYFRVGNGTLLARRRKFVLSISQLPEPQLVLPIVYKKAISRQSIFALPHLTNIATKP